MPRQQTHSVALDGSGDWVDMGTIDAADPLALAGSPLTIHFWALRSTASHDSFSRPINKSTAGSAVGGYSLDLHTTSSFNLSINGVTQTTGSGWFPVDGLWHHIAATADGVNFKFYRDGTLTDTYAHTTLPPATSAVLRLGARENGGNNYKGSLARMFVHNAAMDAAQIKAVFRTGDIPESAAASIVDGWLLDETSGTTANSVNGGVDGSLVGDAAFAATSTINWRRRLHRINRA